MSTQNLLSPEIQKSIDKLAQIDNEVYRLMPAVNAGLKQIEDRMIGKSISLEFWLCQDISHVHGLTPMLVPDKHGFSKSLETHLGWRKLGGVWCFATRFCTIRYLKDGPVYVTNCPPLPLIKTGKFIRIAAFNAMETFMLEYNKHMESYLIEEADRSLIDGHSSNLFDEKEQPYPGPFE